MKKGKRILASLFAISLSACMGPFMVTALSPDELQQMYSNKVDAEHLIFTYRENISDLFTLGPSELKDVASNLDQESKKLTSSRGGLVNNLDLLLSFYHKLNRVKEYLWNPTSSNFDKISEPMVGTNSGFARKYLKACGARQHKCFKFTYYNNNPELRKVPDNSLNPERRKEYVNSNAAMLTALAELSQTVRDMGVSPQKDHRVSKDVLAKAVESANNVARRLDIFKQKADLNKDQKTEIELLIRYFEIVSGSLKRLVYDKSERVIEVLEDASKVVQTISKLPSKGLNPVYAQLGRLDLPIVTEQYKKSDGLSEYGSQEEAQLAVTLFVCQLINFNLDSETVLKMSHAQSSKNENNNAILNKVMIKLDSELNKPWYKRVKYRKELKNLKLVLQALTRIQGSEKGDHSSKTDAMREVIESVLVFRAVNVQESEKYCPINPTILEKNQYEQENTLYTAFESVL